jgi:hypothetical protein
MTSPVAPPATPRPPPDSVYISRSGKRFRIVTTETGKYGCPAQDVCWCPVRPCKEGVRAMETHELQVCPEGG